MYINAYLYDIILAKNCVVGCIHLVYSAFLAAKAM